jgi:hypothetical protein
MLLLLATPAAWLVLNLLLPVAFGSAGDNMPEFSQCVRKCRKSCKSEEIPVYRQHLLWDCKSECAYDCMHEISQALEEYNMVYKFYGHWPYLRIWGLQEPAASIFSLGNMLPHVHNLVYNRQIFLQPGLPLGRHILTYSCVALLAWTASALFHARKIDPFIGFDYGFAFLFISYGLWIVITRLWWEFRREKNQYFKLIFDITFALRVLYQIINILNGNVPFQDHMQLSIGLSILHLVLWLLFCCFSKSPTKLFCLFCQVWFGAASTLELFDFPPYLGIFDAHALWHAATIPLGFLWVHFMVLDSNYWSSIFNNTTSGGESELKEQQNNKKKIS